MEAITQQLLETIKASSTPEGRRNGCGADIQALVRDLLEHNTRAQSTRSLMAEHQARQALVREKINNVAGAEATIDGLLTDLQVVINSAFTVSPIVPAAFPVVARRTESENLFFVVQ
jgi:hypothetical protein